jgi:hypothetical protein
MGHAIHILAIVGSLSFDLHWFSLYGMVHRMEDCDVNVDHGDEKASRAQLDGGCK